MQSIAHYLLNYFLCLLQLGNVRNKYDADEQAAIQHYEVRTDFDLKGNLES